MQLKEYNVYMGERDQMDSDNTNLKRTLEEEKSIRIR